MFKGQNNSTNRKIKKYRKQQKISEETMGKVIGHNRSTYNYRENKSTFTPEEVRKIAAYLKVDLRELDDDLVDYDRAPSGGRLSDVKGTYMRLGDTLIPSEIVLSMERMAKLSEEERKVLLNLIEPLMSMDKEALVKINEYVEFIKSK